MIKACGKHEVMKAVFETVMGGETDKSLEFLKVCCPMYLLHSSNYKTFLVTHGNLLHSNSCVCPSWKAVL